MILTIDEVRLTPWGNVRTGLTSGCFDLLHFHHLHYLERCRAECGFLVVGVDSDALLRQNKGKDPVIPEYHRAAMVAALRCVDAVFILRNTDQFSDLVRGVGLHGPWFDVIFKNSPEIYGKPIVGLEASDPRLTIVPDVHDISSTTGIVEKIRSWPTQQDYTAGQAVVADYTATLRTLDKQLLALSDGELLILPVKDRPYVTEAIKAARKAERTRFTPGPSRRYTWTTRHPKHSGCVVVTCHLSE